MAGTFTHSCDFVNGWITKLNLTYGGGGDKVTFALGDAGWIKLAAPL